MRKEKAKDGKPASKEEIKKARKEDIKKELEENNPIQLGNAV